MIAKRGCVPTPRKYTWRVEGRLALFQALTGALDLDRGNTYRINGGVLVNYKRQRNLGGVERERESAPDVARSAQVLLGQPRSWSAQVLRLSFDFFPIASCTHASQPLPLATPAISHTPSLGQGLAALGFRLRFFKRSPPADRALRPWAFASALSSVHCSPLPYYGLPIPIPADPTSPPHSRQG
jgi:hypothetical protein